MIKDIKQILKISGIYIAAVVGAGFASGREIAQFFSEYYTGGFYGILFAGLLFAVIGWMVLDRVYCERIRSYDEFIYPLLGYPLGRVMELVSTLFMFCLFTIMTAGLVSIIKELFNLPFVLCVMPISVLCLFFIINGIKGVMAVSSYLTPLLAGGILVIGFYIIFTRDTAAFNISGMYNSLTGNWFFSSMLYVGYNSIMAVMVMCDLLPFLKKRKIAIRAGLLGGGALCLIAFILNAALYVFYPGTLTQEMPVLFIINRYSVALSIFYSVILMLAMFISAVTSGYCFVDRISHRLDLGKGVISIIVCIMVIPLSGMGFANLIACIYPIFGYAGLFLVLVILLHGLRSASGKDGINR